MTSPTSRFSKLGSVSSPGGKDAGDKKFDLGRLKRESHVKFGGVGPGSRPSGLPKQSISGLSSTGSSARPHLYRGGIGASMGTTYFLEKQAIVLDFGRSHTKVGFATESRPRHIIPTPELRARRRPGRDVSCTASVEEWIHILDSLMGKVFFHYLSVSPKDRRVVVCDSAHAPAQFRSALAFVLFKKFSIPSVAWVTDLVLPLYLTGLSSGIVIDFGYESTRIMATLNGIPILSAYGVTACSGRLVNSQLRRALRKALQDQDLSWLEDESTIEDLKAKTCYVACGLPSDGSRTDAWKLQTDLSAAFPLRQREVANISEKVRWQPAEVLFSSQVEEPTEEDEDDVYCEGVAPCRGGNGPAGNLPIPELFVEVLEKCPIDVRPIVLQNVVVCGGCAMLRGLLPRLAIELREKLRKDQGTSKVAERLRFTPLDFSPICAVWTGGAVFGSLDGANDFTAEMYERPDEAIPDWCKDGFV